MIESNARVPSSRSWFSYGDILSLNSDQSAPLRQFDEPSLVTFVTQGALIGMLVYFVVLIRALLAHPNFYNFLFISALPEYLAMGGGTGSLVGGVVWALGHLAQRRLGRFARIVIAVVVLTGVWGFFLIIYGTQPGDSSRAPWIASIILVTGTAMGLFIGSRVKPWRELIRGQAGVESGVFSALSGVILRLFVVYFLMLSILFWSILQGLNYSRRDFVVTVVPLIHFACASVILFVRMRFWLLLPLAIIINFPNAAFVTDVLKPDDTAGRVLILTYMGVWATFLFTRTPCFFGQSEPEETDDR